jgi:hypothetical protein
VIDTLTVPLDHFDLTGLIEAYRTFYRKWDYIPFCICYCTYGNYWCNCCYCDCCNNG